MRGVCADSSGGGDSCALLQTQGSEEVAQLQGTLVMERPPDITEDHTTLLQQHRRVEMLRPSAEDGYAARCSFPRAMENVTLLIHCRQQQEICDSRRSLIERYSPYFREVRWLLNWPTESDTLRPEDFRCHGPGDPYRCLLPAMEAIQNSSGLLYMHFDAVISPCTFADMFNETEVGVFSAAKSLQWHSFQQMDRCNQPQWHLHCVWNWWDFKGRHGIRNKILDAVTGLQDAAAHQATFPADRRRAHDLYEQLSTGMWRGPDDFFYLPRSAFPIYSVQAKVFAKHSVFHEMAGPTLLRLTHELAGVGLQDFNCSGNRCGSIQHKLLSSAEFRCGHKVNYRDASIVETVTALLDRRWPEPSNASAVALLSAPNTPAARWTYGVELPITVLVVLASTYAFIGSQWLVERLSKTALSYAVCAAYVVLSVVIDLSIALQSDMSSEDTQYSFEPMCVVLLVEVLKFFVSLGLIMHVQLTQPQNQEAMLSSIKIVDTTWFSITAAIFTLNNILVWCAIGSNSISTFGVFRDTMICWTATLWRLFFKTSLGWGRLGGIAVVVAGLVLNQVGTFMSHAVLSWKVLIILAMTACNALGSVVNEFAMKRRIGLDINVQNLLLYASCIIFTAFSIVVTGRGRAIYENGLLHGFTAHTMFTVCLQAVAGLTISRMLRYADAVQKNIAACLRGPILVVVSPAFTTSRPGWSTVVAALVVATGCFMYLKEGPLRATVHADGDTQAAEGSTDRDTKAARESRP